MTLSTERPRIAVLLGDPSGIGPEMAVKLLARERNLQQADVLLIADAQALASGQAIAQQRLALQRVDSLAQLRFAPGRCTWLAYDGLQGQAPVLGESNEASGRASMQALEIATEAVLAGQADAIVFAPLNKH